MAYRLFLILFIFLFFPPSKIYSQVGIGTVTPDKSAMLDVVSSNRGLLIPRLSLTGTMDSTTITAGNEESLLLYNIATVADVVPGYYYWSNGRWNKIATSVVDSLVTGDNGLTTANGNVRLGGNLVVPTIITASPSNTLAVAGLMNGDFASDDVVVVDRTSGILRKIPANDLLRESQSLIIASEEQTEFTAPLPISDIEKVNVYRNGIRVDFTMVNATTIKLEPEVVCNQNDEIRIVQFY